MTHPGRMLLLRIEQRILLDLASVCFEQHETEEAVLRTEGGPDFLRDFPRLQQELLASRAWRSGCEEGTRTVFYLRSEGFVRVNAGEQQNKEKAARTVCL